MLQFGYYTQPLLGIIGFDREREREIEREAMMIPNVLKKRGKSYTYTYTNGIY